MQFNDLLKNGKIVKEDTTKEKIAEFLEFAENELSASKFNLQKFPLSRSHKEVQDSIIRADELIKKIEGHIKIRPSQKRLF